MIGRMFISMAFYGIYVLSPELYPTDVRGVGMGMSSVFARISGIAAPFIGGPLVSYCTINYIIQKFLFWKYCYRMN